MPINIKITKIDCLHTIVLLNWIWDPRFLYFPPFKSDAWPHLRHCRKIGIPPICLLNFKITFYETINNKHVIPQISGHVKGCTNVPYLISVLPLMSSVMKSRTALKEMMSSSATQNVQISVIVMAYHLDVHHLTHQKHWV